MTNAIAITAIYTKFSGDTEPTTEDMYEYLTLAEQYDLSVATAKILDDGTIGDYLTGDTASSAEKVTSVFEALFDRAPTEAGLAYWVDQLENNSAYVSGNSLVQAVLRGAEAQTEMTDGDSSDWDAVSAYAEDLADDLVAYVPETPETPETDGSTFYLTSGTDASYMPDNTNATGTDDADTFYAYIQQNSLVGGVSNSLSSADHLDGGGSTDTLHAELLTEFYGITGGNQSEIAPHTTSIENITFDAKDGDSEFNDNTVIVDGNFMYGVESIGSKDSDGDLIIENLTTLANDGETIRSTADMTITMDHTDNMNSDTDASDLTVLFDEDYLNVVTTNTGSTLTINLVNALNLKLDDGSSLIEGFETVTFNVGDEEIVVDVSGAELSEVQGLIETAVADAGYENITVSTYTEPAYFAGNIYYENTDTTYAAGSAAGNYTAFRLVNTDTEELVEGGFTLTDGQKDGSIIYSQDDNESTQITAPISINVELDKVGDDGVGGNLKIGGKDTTGSDTDVDKNDGIDIFNITVLGDEDRPSNLGMITSTNGALDTVVIDSETRTDNKYAALTVRGETSGTPAIGNTAAVAPVAAAAFGGTLDLLDANSFKGDLYIGETGAAENIDTFTALGGGDVYLNETIDESGIFEVTTGSGEDTLIIDLDGDSVDALDESFALSSGGADDTVTFTGAKNVSDATTLALDNVNITLGSGEDTLYLNTEIITKVNAGTDSDFVVVDANDSTTNGTTGSWTVGTGTDGTAGSWDARVLYEATVTVDFAGFEQELTIPTTSSNNFVATQEDINAAIIAAIEANPELDRLLDTKIGTGSEDSQMLTITSTVQGVNDLTITINQPTIDTAANVLLNGTGTAISDLHFAAVEAGLIETSAAIDSSDIPNNTEAEVMLAFNVTANLDGNLNETGAVATNDLVVDSVAADGTDNTTATSKAIIDMSTGLNDLVVLDSDIDSTDTLVFSADWDKVSVVNFDGTTTLTPAVAAVQEVQTLTFSDAGDIIGNGDITVNLAGGQSTTVTVATGDTAETIADNVAAAISTDVQEQSVVTFGALTTGETVTVDGLTFTATANTTAAQVATAFNAGTSGFGTFSGSLTDFTISGFGGTTVTYDSNTAFANVTDIVVSDTAVTNATVVTTQGFTGVTATAGTALLDDTAVVTITYPSTSGNVAQATVTENIVTDATFAASVETAAGVDAQAAVTTNEVSTITMTDPDATARSFSFDNGAPVLFVDTDSNGTVTIYEQAEQISAWITANSANYTVTSTNFSLGQIVVTATAAVNAGALIGTTGVGAAAGALDVTAGTAPDLNDITDIAGVNTIAAAESVETQTLTVTKGADQNGTITVTTENNTYDIPVTTGNAADVANEVAAWLTANATAEFASATVTPASSDVVLVWAAGFGAEGAVTVADGAVKVATVAATTTEGVLAAAALNATTNGDILDFTAWLDDTHSTSGSAESAEREATSFDDTDSVASIDLESNLVSVLNDFTSTATESWASLTAEELQVALNGTVAADDYANISAVATTNANVLAGTTLQGTSIDSILMIENDTNAGEYMVFNVETTGLNTAAEAFAVSLVGTIDFGETQVDMTVNNVA